MLSVKNCYRRDEDQLRNVLLIDLKAARLTISGRADSTWLLEATERLISDGTWIPSPSPAVGGGGTALRAILPGEDMSAGGREKEVAWGGSEAQRQSLYEVADLGEERRRATRRQEGWECKVRKKGKGREGQEDSRSA